MSKTVVVMFGIIIIVLIVLSIFGTNKFDDIIRKVDSTSTNIKNAQQNINDAIKNMDTVKSSLIEAKLKIDSANRDLTTINKKLKQEFSRIQADIAKLEEKRRVLDKQIEEQKNRIPGDIKDLKEPNYKKIGESR